MALVCTTAMPQIPAGEATPEKMPNLTAAPGESVSQAKSASQVDSFSNPPPATEYVPPAEEISSSTPSVRFPADQAAGHRDFRVVRLADIDAKLETCTAAEVLTELSTTDNLLWPVGHRRCGLVSYRQEWAQAGEYAGLTLDGPAFVGVLAAARSVGLEALWLDAWCYRFVGEYDHSDFCRTLHVVVTNVAAVVWLPRTRVDSKGEYPYRLWCTFEALCVQELGLPVAIAGAGLSGFQKRVRRLGSLTPALRADGTLDALCRLNLLFYLSEASAAYAIGANVAAHRPTFAPLFGAFLLLGYPFIWFVLRAMLGQQVRLARNASRVLRSMTSASAE